MNEAQTMNRPTILLLVALFFITGLASLALAEPTGATITPGVSETTVLPAAQALNIQGGYVTYVDVRGGIVTTRWGGFFGNITGEARLGDGSGNYYYIWTVTDPTNAVVYVSTDSITSWDFTDFRPANAGDMPAYLQASVTDNFASTFTQAEAFDSASLFIPVTPYTTTWQDGTQGSLRTYALYNSADNAVIWAGKAQGNVQGFQPGKTVDYQLLVPAFGTETYNFYLELP
ncbi:hypothetical protein K9M74_00575 [Candidatus Woesearchaeota archaeon]|nr:hypothetical protein [Candidatus Woesearchaeota archaeon]